LTLDFLLTPHGTLLVIVVGGGRKDPRWLRLTVPYLHDDDEEEEAFACAHIRLLLCFAFALFHLVRYLVRVPVHYALR